MQKWNVLIVEDSESDAGLIARYIERSGHELHWERVDEAQALQRALARRDWDVVLCDFSMPGFSGRDALSIVLASGMDLPFIFVSGTMGEDIAVEAMRAGACDYVFKGKLKRLVPAIEREVAEKQALASRREAEQWLSLRTSALEAVANAVVITDRDGGIRWVNHAFTQLTGYSFEEAIGQNPRLLKSGQHRDEFYENLWATIKAGDAWRGELVNRRKDGTFYAEEQTITPVKNRDGTITHFVAIKQDVTERKRAADQLSQAHEQLRRLLQDTPAVIYSLEVERGRVTPSFASENIKRMLGFTVAESLSLERWKQQVHPDDKERVFASIAETLRKGAFTCEYRLQHKDGHFVWVEDNRRVIYDASGSPSEISGVWIDVTARKNAEIAALEAESKYRAIFDNAIEGLFQTTKEGRFLSANPAMAKILGFESPEQLIAERLDISRQGYATAGDRKKFQRALDKFGAVNSFEYQAIRKDGSVIWVSENARAVRNSAGELLHYEGSLTDITERKRTEEALRKSEARFSTIFSSTPAGIGITAVRDGKFLQVNDHHCEFFGYGREEMIGRTAMELGLWAKPEERAQIMERLKNNESIRNVETTFRRKSGEIRTALIAVEQVGLAGESEPVLVWTAADITEKKQIEAQFLRAQRIESIGALASGVAHDLNNVLAPILMVAEVLRAKDLDPDVLRMLETVESCARRGAGVVSQVLMFARGVEGQPVEVTPKHLFRELLQMLRPTFPKNISLIANSAKDAWALVGDPTQLHQLLLNLCVNARDAMPDGGKLSLASENLTVDDTFAGMRPDVKPGPYVCIKVTDTGSGIPSGLRAKIFEPFFTTKPLGKGTGLGLATVANIVKAHHGFLEVESEVGVGTTFSIYLPARPADSELDAIAEAPLAQGNGELLLVVDDEAAVRNVLTRMFEAHGYSVIAAVDGTDGVALFAKHQQEVKVVITDFRMPNMDGVTMAQVLLRLNPKIKIIVSTGASSGLVESGKQADLRKLGIKDIVSKPYTVRKIISMVQELLKST